MNSLTDILAESLKQHNRHRFSTFDSECDIHSTIKIKFLAACGLHIAVSVSKMTISSHNINILLSSVIHWHSNGFNGDADFFIFNEMKMRRKL